MVNTVIINTASLVEFKNPIAERFFNNIDAAAEEYLLKGKEHSLATITGILGVDNISKDSPEYKNIARLIQSYSKHQQTKRA